MIAIRYIVTAIACIISWASHAQTDHNITTMKRVAEGFTFAPPTLLAPTEVTTTSFCVNWNDAPEAETYGIELMKEARKPMQSILLNENFTSLKTESGIDDGNYDMSRFLDYYTKESGWTGSKIYTSSQGVKVGNEKEAGYLTTPLINCDCNLTVNMMIYKTDEKTVFAEILSEDGEVIRKESFNDSKKEPRILLNFNSIGTGRFQLRLSSESAIYVGSMTLYEGAYSSYDLVSGKARENTLSIEGVTGNSYRFSGLRERKYKYRVRSIGMGYSSYWSDYEEIILPEDDGVSELSPENYGRSIFYSAEGIRTSNVSSKGITVVYRNGKYIKLLNKYY